MTKPRLRLVAPTTENRTVTPRRPKNRDVRTREHLTIDEVERLIEAAKNNRYGHRDALMVLLAFRHGLRAGEVVDLRWDQIDFKAATLHVRRLKKRHPQRPSSDGPRAAGPAAPSARERKIAVCVRLRARRATLCAGFLSHGRTGSGFCEAGNQDACAHASARLRLQAGQRRPRHPCIAGLPRTSKHSEYDAVHCASPRSIQKLLERLAAGDFKEAPHAATWSIGEVNDVCHEKTSNGTPAKYQRIQRNYCGHTCGALQITS
jgi:hypothetical protein